MSFNLSLLSTDPRVVSQKLFSTVTPIKSNGAPKSAFFLAFGQFLTMEMMQTGESVEKSNRVEDLLSHLSTCFYIYIYICSKREW